MKTAMIRGVALIAAWLVCGAPHAEPPAQTQSCVACHGARGVSNNPAWPNLAGQHESYLVLQLEAMRSGERYNAQMAPFVKNLSDEDIQILASWYAKQPPVTMANGNAERVDRGRQLAGTCTACHGYQGRPVANEWPILSGQHAAYLQSQLLAYKRGERIHPLMQAAVAAFDEDSFDALAAYYSQLEY